MQCIPTHGTRSKPFHPHPLGWPHLAIFSPSSVPRTSRNSLGSFLSLGLMQRIYEGSFEIRISRRLLKLFLNCVPTCPERKRKNGS